MEKSLLCVYVSILTLLFSQKLPARQCSNRLQIRTLLIHHLDVYLAFLCPIRDRFLCLQQRRGYFLLSRTVFPHLVLLLFFVFRTNNSGFQLWFRIATDSVWAACARRILAVFGSAWVEFGCPSSKISDFFTSTVGRQNQS